MGLHSAAVRPIATAVPTTHLEHSNTGNALRQPPATAAQTVSADYIFVLHPSVPLPVVELSCTPAQRLFSQHTHRIVLRFVRNHFYHFVWFFRFGISCFVAVLFVQDDFLRNFFLAAMIPAHLLIIATVAFLSCDILWLLVHSYDFWLATFMNTLNWLALGVVLGDKRAVASILGWFGMQIVNTVDASYRTYFTAVASMRLGVPIVLVLFGFVSLRSIDGAHFFNVTINGHNVSDAADIMGFTTFTLAIVLGKIVYQKKRRVASPRGGGGYLRIPCAIIKVTLRLDRSACDGRSLDSSRLGSLTAKTSHASSSTARERKGKQHALHPSTKQRFKLSPLKITQIDARRTILPFHFWCKPGSFLFANQNLLRVLLYALGAVGFGILTEQSMRIYSSIMRRQSFAAISSSPNTSKCRDYTHFHVDHVLVLVASVFSIFFCGIFVLFFQRDLLRLLFTNFDYIFSIAQITAYEVCVLDMVCWDLHLSLVIAMWSLWLLWALTIDALTPLVKRSIFRLPTKVAAIVLACVLVSGLSTSYVVIFVDNNGLRYRTITRFTISSAHTFALTTRSILLGRAATITLWCTRQVVVLFRRREGELHLIRGLVKYESPYGLFPPKLNKHTPAFVDDA